MLFEGMGPLFSASASISSSVFSPLRFHVWFISSSPLSTLNRLAPLAVSCHHYSHCTFCLPYTLGFLFSFLSLQLTSLPVQVLRFLVSYRHSLGWLFFACLLFLWALPGGAAVVLFGVSPAGCGPSGVPVPPVSHVYHFMQCQYR